MSIGYSIAEQNVAHFKFLSQHFHKSIALVTNTSEFKGKKAHNRFAQLCGHASYDELFYWLKGHNKRVFDFPPLTSANVRRIYQDLYPDIDAEELFTLYYDFFFFSHQKLHTANVSLASLKELKSFTFFPKRPGYSLDSVADNLAVALDSFSSILSGPKTDRNMLNSVITLYFSFYQQGFITDFGFKDVVDLTNPRFYHDAFIKYKMYLNPAYHFEGHAIHCYDKIAFYTSAEHQAEYHKTLCDFFSSIQKKPINPESNHNDILFYKVFNSLNIDPTSGHPLSNSFEEAEKRPRPTLNDFDFSKVKNAKKSSGRNEE